MTLTSKQSAHPVPPEQVDLLPRSRFLFFSSCPEIWGGSEELWAAAARNLAKGGHTVAVCKTVVDRQHPRIAELLHAGVDIYDYRRVGGVLLARATARLVSDNLHRPPTETKVPPTPLHFGVGARYWKSRYAALIDAALAVRINSRKPDFAVVSQGENFDGIRLALACRNQGVRSALVCQTASDFHWPPDSIRDQMQSAFRNAVAVYFVSKHNRTLTERQLGFALPNAEVVRNPFLTDVDGALPYPEDRNGRLRLACLARLFTLEKGQDTLLQILSQEKWRRRNIEVNFYGEGPHRIALEQAAAMLDLPNVSFKGFTTDIAAVWRQHHALILPSRCEGLPLVVVEAMLCGRPVIVTNAGGNREVVDDGETGFLADGTDVASLDDAMERAWSRRAEWEHIGRQAAIRIRELVPTDPGAHFTIRLTSVFSNALIGGLRGGFWK